nr:putative ribonuclease H-like domain-containing protein [Tanacetum cinerariifolium]
VLVVKPHFKTPYELFKGRSPALSFIRPFGCHVTILNTLDQLGKFNGKSDEGIFVCYSTISKAFRVYNIMTRKVEENLHITFLENKPMIVGGGPEWLFDIDALSKSMNYAPIPTGTNSNDFAGKRASFDAGQSSMETGPSQDYILIPLWKDNSLFDFSSQASDGHNKDKHGPSQTSENDNQERPNADSSTKTVNTAGPVNTATPRYADYPNDPLMPDLEDARSFDDAYDDRDKGAEADYNNLEAVISVTPIPSTRIHKDHPKEQIIEETLVGLPYGKRAIGTKWVYRNKRYQRGIVVRNKASLVAQGHRQEEGIDYDEVFAPVARIEAIRLFLAYASFMYFTVYQIDVKSAFLYDTIKEEVYVSQPPGFVDPEFPNRVYKVEKALYGLHQAPRAWYETLSTYLLDNVFRRRTIDKTLFIKKIKDDIILVQVYVDDIIFGSTKRSLSTEFEQLMHKRFQMSSIEELTFFLEVLVEQQKDGIFLSQDKYVCDILKKFDFSSVKSASTPMKTHKPLSNNAAGIDVDVHLHRSMIGSLMYLTSSRTDIMFTIYLKGQPTLGLWYPKESPLELIDYSDSDYASASLDRKSITGGCQFLGSRLISWQCKKQTIVANSTTEAEYIAASNYCGQVLWLQNQLLDYGYNFMQTKIYVDNKSVICMVKNPVYHSKTKHIEIRHHFIRDSYEKRLIEMVKLHTNYNVADLLIKAFDVTRFQFLIASIEKPSKSDGFEQIVDFLNANQIKYALTTSPTIYTACIKQFWITLKIRTVNDDVRLQALIDGKKVVITEASIMHDLQLNDAKANNQKFNFSKYILDNLKKNLEADVPFYMFPRVRTGFFGAVTPLFSTMMVQAVKEKDDLPTTVQDTPIRDAPSSSQPQRKHKPRRKEKKETKVSPTELHTEDHVPTTSNDLLPSGEDSMPLKELIVLCTNLSNKVLDLENEVIDMKSSHKAKIAELESMVDKLEEENKSLTKELKSFNSKVESLAFKETVMDKEKSSKQGRKIADINADAEVNLDNVYNLDMAHKETVLSMQDVTDADGKEVAEEIVEVITTTKIIVDEVSTAGGELDAANEEPVSAAPTNITTTQSSEATKITIDITTAPKAKWIVFHDIEESTTRTASSKPQVKDKGKAKLVEKTEVLKSRKAQIVIDEEVGRRIEAEWNADMKDNIIGMKFKETQPKEVLDVFLWHNLKVMFEHSVEDSVWKLQKGPKGLARVKNWKLFDSCGVHCVTLDTIQLYLLAEKIYTLTNYTLQQMFNEVRLQVGYEVEMAYDLLRLTFFKSLGINSGTPSRRLKFVRIGEDYQEYGLTIPDVMLTDAIKRSESYQMFIKYSTDQIPPKKSRGKGSQGNKTADTPVEEVKVSKESKPKPTKKKTSSKRRVKKKVTLSADNNIISNDPDAALELAKITRSADIMQALKESKNSIKRQSGTKGPHEGTSTIPRVLDESTVISTTSSEGTGGKPGVLDEKKDIIEEKVILDDTQDADDEDVDTESDEDDIYKYKIYVRKDEDEEMINAEVDDSDKGDEEITDAAKADAEKTSKQRMMPKRPNSIHQAQAYIVAKLEKDMSKLKIIDHSTEALAILKSYVPFVVDNYIGSKVRDVFQKELKKHTTYLIQKYSLQQFPESNKKQTLTVDIEIKREQAKKQQKPKFTIKNLANHRLYHALIEALVEDENEMDKGVTDTVNDHKRKHDDDEDDDDEDPPAGPNHGSKTGKSASAKEQVEEPISKVVIDDAGTCSSNIELEYNFQECFNTLTNKLDWNNSKGDRYPFDYFFNNDLEYLKTFDPEVTYTTSIMKIKAARYEIKGIEYMVPTLWSTIKHAHDKDAEKGIKHWGERRKLWYRSPCLEIIRYGHLEEIVVKRSDQQLYKFKEGIVYEDLNKQIRVLRADELYKFSNGTLKSVRDEIHQRVLKFRLDYNKEMPKRKWTAVDQKRSGLMIELIDKQLLDRILLDKFDITLIIHISDRGCFVDKFMSRFGICNTRKGFGLMDFLKILTLPLQVLDNRLAPSTLSLSPLLRFGVIVMDVAFYFMGKDNDGINVAFTNGNNSFWFGAVLEIIREIEHEKDLVLKNFKSCIGSSEEEDSFGIEKSLRWIATNLKKIGYVLVRIRPDSTIKLVIPNHLHVGTLDMEIVQNKDLNDSRTSENFLDEWLFDMDPEEELHVDTPAETPTVKDKGKGILIEDPKPMKKKDQIEMDAEYAKKLQEELVKEYEEAYKQIDWNAAFDHVQAKETQYIKRYHGFKKKPQSESEARKNMISYLKNTEGFKMEFFKGKTYDQILPIFQARFDANLKFLFKTREEMEKEDEEIIKSINETPAQKAAKRRKMSEEAQEADNLRGRLEIVQDEDDDVFVEAIPLAQKVLVVDYQVVVIDNKPRYKIIRADDTHQLYISFTTLLKNFNKEDLETLWRIVKDRFSTKKPTNFSDEYLLLTLKTMFGELDEQDPMWRNKKSVHGLALVKRWKLLTSCGVHVIILSTVQLFLLVERRYPLSRFTLEQLVNVARL